MCKVVGMIHKIIQCDYRSNSNAPFFSNLKVKWATKPIYTTIFKRLLQVQTRASSLRAQCQVIKIHHGRTLTL